MLRVNKGIWAIGIPVILSFITVLKPSVLLLAALVVTHFILLRLVPSFKGYENLWMFVLVAVSSVPINVCLLVLANDWGLVFDSFIILGIFRCILYYAILLSVEEIVMGVITRFIWRKQYKLVL